MLAIMFRSFGLLSVMLPDESYLDVYVFLTIKTIVILLDWFWFDFWCFNATFNNISAISWRPVLGVEETAVPGENHRPWASNW